ncbi:hypothetical protein A2662_01390 [Candidatus Giovannonibacteria bacterium RIFCSPHIGHO2_01_FULL_45_33]|uniref:Uncharacterized protein n=1 Tax=Candidatus Giovannonibacteria bacterium RIFCSPLOWO2_01_FULL_45_34 TaxID=1798351 RepID=A0A1F5WZS8_9BACT|nr:MAG: hypothetical protein A2662_01390 [Candidatus Giovannonibacteria bacterium RIFCSPHIGHO2_01_FULL_45_33]OGF69688.1 MAG: hypothetical protein A3C73_00100 [Candidatus Giovannonibacteria bacterium RIFCSPHIGHO2_02_FULL_44_11]OGF81148.1 MAG: hypothetical protein A2930_01105 [Candidatus Giovannonibacteria bacterium RIFCSPLOWO2_01_FULL_45_34]
MENNKPPFEGKEAEEFMKALIELEKGGINENASNSKKALRRKIYASVIFLIILIKSLAFVEHYDVDRDPAALLVAIALVGFMCVLFSQRLGSLKGYISVQGSGTYINKASPPTVVEFMGWILLLLPVVIFLLSFF